MRFVEGPIHFILDHALSMHAEKEALATSCDVKSPLGETCSREPRTWLENLRNTINVKCNTFSTTSETHEPGGIVFVKLYTYSVRLMATTNTCINPRS
jgi:hypothetical protein